MGLFRLAVVPLLLVCFSASAQSGWRDMQGNPIPNTPETGSKDGFNATLVITPDRDWEAKWNTPPETVPHFSGASEVSAGGELFILAFVSNPAIDATGSADVGCDIRVVMPDGTAQFDERGIDCMKGQLGGEPSNVYLLGTTIKYVAEPKDQRGKWTVHMRVRDRNRDAEVPLQASFVVR